MVNCCPIHYTLKLSYCPFHLTLEKQGARPGDLVRGGQPGRLYQETLKQVKKVQVSKVKE